MAHVDEEKMTSGESSLSGENKEKSWVPFDVEKAVGENCPQYKVELGTIFSTSKWPHRGGESPFFRYIVFY